MIAKNEQIKEMEAMLRGLYTATTAMMTNHKKLDVVTNNLANGNTTGYKKDLVLTEAFPEVLITKINAGIDFMDREGFKGVEVQEENGKYSVSTTGGFFRTQTINGISYEKHLKFTVNEEGYLSTYYEDAQGNIDTDSGYLVLGNRGPIQVGDGQLEINERGQVLVDGNIVDNLVMRTPPGVIGTLNGGIRLDRIEVNYRQGQLYETENPLDIALKGEGFFTVQTPEGLRYTRDGAFKLNAQNELVTADGYPVMGMDGPIVLEGKEVAITPIGEIMVDGEFVDQLHIVDIANLKDLRKVGHNLYRMAEGLAPEEQPFTGEVLQGFLENSNVNTIKEMVEMISLLRNYESNQRIVKAYDDTLQKAVNEIGRV